VTHRTHRGRPSRLPAQLIVGLVAACALAACQAKNKPSEAGEPRIGDIPTVRSEADIVLPMDSYRPTAEQQRAVSNAGNILGRECMKRFGLDWPASQAAALPGMPRNARRYSVVDPDKVATDGYHAVEQLRAQQIIQAQRADLPAPSNDAVNVWGGRGQSTYNGQAVPAGGCGGEATRKLAGGVVPPDVGLAEKLQLDSFNRTRSDSRVVRAFAAWSSCMEAQGYDYPDPFVAVNDQRWQTNEISKQEIATAVTDVTCKIEAKVAGTMLAVEMAYQQRLIDKHASELNAIKAFLAAETTAAGKVVSGGQVVAGSGG
jgi:hypothetical protein